MTDAWITMASTNVEAMVNPINAACDRGFIPETIYILDNPGVSDQVDEAINLATTIITAYDGAEPDIDITTLESEVEFDRIRTYIQESIELYQNEGDHVAVDITPGRKFMSAIAFAAGMKYEADHVFYFYLNSTDYFGHLYPTMPQTATHLYDFMEEL